ncbi:MAG: PhoU domain-containing protein [Acidobacteriaceae bacterium]
MNSQRHIQILRVHLLAMSRLAQRALDYSIKGYELRNLDFARRVPAANGELDAHYRQIKELSRELMNGGAAKPSDSRFALAAVSIGTALHLTHSAAAAIAQDSVRLLETSGIHKCAPLDSMAQLVNGSIRLCIVSLFQQDAAHARTVLRHQETLRFRELTSSALHPHIDRWAGAQGDFERSVIRSLGQVAKQAHEIAEAILFWLEGRLNVEGRPSASVEGRHISLEFPSARLQGDAAGLRHVPSKSIQSVKLPQCSPC